MSSYTRKKKTGKLDGWVFNISLAGAVISLMMLLLLPESEVNLPTSEALPFYKNYKIMVFIYMSFLYMLSIVVIRALRGLVASILNVFFAVCILVISIFSGAFILPMLIVSIVNIIVAFTLFADSYNAYNNQKIAQRRAEKAREAKQRHRSRGRRYSSKTEEKQDVKQ